MVNDALFVSNRTTLLRVRGSTVEPVGISDASPPTVSAVGYGGLDAGRYVVAAAFLRGDIEGGLSVLRAAQVESGGGLRLTNLPTATDATGLRIYRTMAGAETLQRVADLPLGLPEYMLGAGVLGEQAETRHLRRMPPGERVAEWRGRLLTASGRWLRVSRPMRHHLHDPRTGFVAFAERITMLAPVQAGVFVGTKAGVELLRLLAQHPEVEIKAITSRGEAGMPVADMFPSLRRDFAPSREPGEDTAGTLASRSTGGGFPGTDEACSGYLRSVECFGGGRTGGSRDANREG